MVKLVIIGGAGSEKLAAFMRDRGVFEVVDFYENLTDNVALIQSKIVDADKLLYLYYADEKNKRSDINIKSDMQALHELLGSAGSRTFFKIGEIDFVTGEGELSEMATRYFVTVMKQCPHVKYTVKVIRGRNADSHSKTTIAAERHFTFSEVYDAVMGVSATRDFKNKFIANYKVERNADANIDYSPQNDIAMIVEPFRFNDLNEYKRRQETAERIDSGTIYRDEWKNAHPAFENPVMGGVDAGLFPVSRKAVLISGKKKSGKSVWAAQIAASSQKCGVTGCVLDFTHNSDVMDLLKESDVNVEYKRMLELLRLTESKRGSLYYCSPCDDSEVSVMFEFMQNFFIRQRERFDTIFIVVEYDVLSEVYDLLAMFVNDVIVTCTALVQDVKLCQKLLIQLSNSVRVSLILNKNIELGFHTYPSIEDIKIVNDRRIRLVENKDFINMQSKAGIYKSLIMM